MHFCRAGSACVVGALAPYNHGVPLAGAARRFKLSGVARPTNCSAFEMEMELAIPYSVSNRRAAAL